jgi:thymidylate synthase (FAD)
MKIELISWTKDPISTVAKAASMCYDSKPSINIVKHCINSGHTSILEHANFTFKIEGVSRSLLA